MQHVALLHSQWVVGCLAPVLWLCLSLLVVPLRTLTAGNGARAHGARAKAGTQYFFRSSTTTRGPTATAQLPLRTLHKHSRRLYAMYAMYAMSPASQHLAMARAARQPRHVIHTRS
jgi:hypothetical protein